MTVLMAAVNGAPPIKRRNRREAQETADNPGDPRSDTGPAPRMRGRGPTDRRSRTQHQAPKSEKRRERGSGPSGEVSRPIRVGVPKTVPSGMYPEP